MTREQFIDLEGVWFDIRLGELIDPNHGMVRYRIQNTYAFCIFDRSLYPNKFGPSHHEQAKTHPATVAYHEAGSLELIYKLAAKYFKL